MAKYGFSDAQWQAAKSEAMDAIVRRAKVRGMIPYSDLAMCIRAISLDAHDPRLFDLLGEISADEDMAGRGMISALVVHKNGDMQPGPGFFDLAKRLGRSTMDIEKCWIAEVKKVHAVWSK